MHAFFCVTKKYSHNKVLSVNDTTMHTQPNTSRRGGHRKTLPTAGLKPQVQRQTPKQRTMTNFLHCMQANYGALIRDMLQADELLPLLPLCNAGNTSQQKWARQLTANVQRVRSATEPVRNMRLRFPGCMAPLHIRCAAKRSPPPGQDPIESYDKLREWLYLQGLSAFTPCKAILVMNAWPRCTRHAAANLSDFLAEANTQFVYTTTQFTHKTAETTCEVMQLNVEAFFTYKGLTGSLKVQERCEWPYTEIQA